VVAHLQAVYRWRSTVDRLLDRLSLPMMTWCKCATTSWTWLCLARQPASISSDHNQLDTIGRRLMTGWLRRWRAERQAQPNGSTAWPRLMWCVWMAINKPINNHDLRRSRQSAERYNKKPRTACFLSCSGISPQHARCAKCLCLPLLNNAFARAAEDLPTAPNEGCVTAS
jgi:hypothetical protein